MLEGAIQSGTMSKKPSSKSTGKGKTPVDDPPWDAPDGAEAPEAPVEMAAFEIHEPALFADDELPASGATGTPYVVLARKYRPETFDDLIGQQAMVQDAP